MRPSAAQLVMGWRPAWGSKEHPLGSYREAVLRLQLNSSKKPFKCPRTMVDKVMDDASASMMVPIIYNYGILYVVLSQMMETKRVLVTKRFTKDEYGWRLGGGSGLWWVLMGCDMWQVSESQNSRELLNIISNPMYTCNSCCRTSLPGPTYVFTPPPNCQCLEPIYTFRI